MLVEVIPSRNGDIGIMHNYASPRQRDDSSALNPYATYIVLAFCKTVAKPYMILLILSKDSTRSVTVATVLSQDGQIGNSGCEIGDRQRRHTENWLQQPLEV